MKLTRPSTDICIENGSHRQRRTRWLLATIALFAGSGILQAEPAGPEQSKPMVLFISIDDVSLHRFGYAGNEVIQTPNFDRLAGEGTWFQLAHCNAPPCNPSRSSLFSGIRPETLGVFHNSTDWREVLTPGKTLPEHFMQHGYDAIRVGKMFHGGTRRNGVRITFDDDKRWTETIDAGAGAPLGNPLRGPGEVIEQSAVEEPGKEVVKNKTNYKYGSSGRKDADTQAARAVDMAIEVLSRQRERPLFLALGLQDTHLPHTAPEEYFHLYPWQEMELPRNPASLPNGLPIDQSLLSLDNPHTVPQWKQAIAAHYATITLIDRHIGRLLDYLELSGKDDETIVVVWSDHGFLLGEHYQWRKSGLVDEGLVVPLLFKVPGITVPGTVCSSPVELVDLFPTLCELSGIPIPDYVEGLSMADLLKDPQRPFRTGAISLRHGPSNRSIRTERYRYTEYGSPADVELFDHQLPEPLASTDVSDKPEYRAVLRHLNGLLESGWKATLPDDLRQRLSTGSWRQGSYLAGEDYSRRIIDRAGERGWIHDMQVIVGMKGMPEENVDYDRIVAEIDPEFNDWSGPPYIAEFLPYGIRSSESVNKFSKTWPDEELNRQFAGAVCRTVTGRKATSTTMRGTKQTMCHNDPEWHRFKMEDILDNLGRAKNRPPVGGINQDLLNVIRPEPGFCEDDQREFRAFLRRNFKPQELQSMGVADLDSFDFCDYLKDRSLDNELIVDPLVRNYILSLNLSQLAAWEDIVSAAHDLEKTLGRGIFMTGNQHPGEVVYGSMLSRVNDIVSDEKDSWFDEYAHPRSGAISTVAKLSSASGGYEKPVWFRGGLYDRNRLSPEGREYRMRLYGEVFQDLVHGEAFANGVVRVFDLANEASPAPEPPYEHRESFFRRFADYARLIDDHRAVFQDRDNAAEVGLVYSVATQLWESFSPLNIRIKNHYERFLGWGRALEEMHCPYQVVIFGHPDAFPSENLRQQLSRYRVLVVPGVECLSDQQGKALRSFVEAGGTLVYSGDMAVYDENRFKRDAPLFEDLPRLMRDSVKKGKAVGLFDNDLQYYNRVSGGEPPAAVDFHAMREAVMWGLNGQSQVEAAAPRTVQFNLWLAKNRRSASLHMVNYGVDLMGNYAEPIRDFEVSIRLPSDLITPERITLLRPGRQDQDLPFEMTEDGCLHTRIPELRVWGILVFSVAKEQEAASALAMLRKQLRKRTVLGMGDVQPFVDEYARAHDCYSKHDYERALDLASDLLERTTPQAGQTAVK